MTPLDLRTSPPRSPRAELANIVFLPRSIDKLRAALPGGELGEYTIEGFTTLMFERLGIAIPDVSAVVASAASEDEVAAFVAEHAQPGGAGEWNAFALHRVIYNGDRADAEADIPWLRDHPEIVLTLDLLAEDDRRSFPASPAG